MAAIVLSTLPYPTQSGDKLVSKVVTGAIAALFRHTETIEATVRAEPVSKLLQGSLDSFDLIGHNLLMHNGLQIKAMELYLQSISIDFGAIFLGKVKLRQPTTASMRVVLTQEDLCNSFNTPFILEKLSKLQYQGQGINLENISINLDKEQSLRVSAQANLDKSNEEQPIEISFTARLEAQERRKIQFTNPSYEGDPEAIELGKTVIGYINELLDLEKFALDGVDLRIDRLRIQNQQIIFYGTAQINQFPQRNKP